MLATKAAARATQGSGDVVTWARATSSPSSVGWAFGDLSLPTVGGAAELRLIVAVGGAEGGCSGLTGEGASMPPRTRYDDTPSTSSEEG